MNTLTITLQEKIERWKALADIFIDENTPVFIRDISNQYYFGHILLCGDRTFEIECFGPTSKKGIKYVKSWVEVLEMERYIPRGAE